MAQLTTRPRERAPVPPQPAGTALAGPAQSRLAALSDGLNAATPVQRLAELAPPNRTGLPDGLKAGIEALSGMSLDGVRVHYNSAEPAQFHAHAYAQGTDIHLAPGQERHLPHEAWHVVQQAQGRVRPTMQMHGAVPVNTDDALEREADAMGARAVQMKADPGFHGAGCGCGGCGAGQRMLQRMPAREAPVQRCVHCGDNSCIKGEKCGYDRTMGGLFTNTNAPAVLPYNSSNAKKQSGKSFGTELEHVIPGAALRLMGQGGGYRQEYTVPIDYGVHRGGVSGAGGGISSTGRSTTSQGWAQHLSNLPTDFAVVRATLNDEINAHIMQNAFTESVAQRLSDWLVAQEMQAGRITTQERQTLQQLLMNRYYDRR